MAEHGALSNDDQISRLLKEEYLEAVVLDGEAHYSDRPTDCYACIVRAQISAQTGSIAEICQYLEYKFPKGVEQ